MGIHERKEREKERRRQQILVSAKRVFSDRGFSRTTMEDIANEAELSPGTLYLYFKNKEELFASLSLRIFQYMIIRLEEVSNDIKMNPREKLEALKLAMFDVYDFDTASITNMFHLQSSEALKNLSSQVLAEFNTLSTTCMGLLTSIFKEGCAKGVFIDSPPEALADTFWSLFSGVVLWEASKTIMDGEKDSLKESLNFSFFLFNRGILVDHGES
ncbi:MAG: TetR/AcrR family transcriptional regulator [Pseudomonadota bacterium]